MTVSTLPNISRKEKMTARKTYERQGEDPKHLWRTIQMSGVLASSLECSYDEAVDGNMMISASELTYSPIPKRLMQGPTCQLYDQHTTSSKDS
jgi:hypothetical protein